MNATLKKEIQEVIDVVKTCPEHLQLGAFEILSQHAIDRSLVDPLDQAMKHFQEKLNSVGDDAQLANIDLTPCRSSSASRWNGPLAGEHSASGVGVRPAILLIIGSRYGPTGSFLTWGQ